MAKSRRDRRMRRARTELRPRVREQKSGLRTAVLGLGFLATVVAVFILVYWVRFPGSEPQQQTGQSPADPPAKRTRDQTDLNTLTALFTALDESQYTPEEMDRALRHEQLAVTQHLVKILPDNAHALFILAMACQEQGNSVKATAYLEQCLQHQPGRADALDHLARIAQEGGEHERAVTFFQQALTRDPGLAGVHYRLAEALKLQGKPQAALIELGKHVAKQPQDAQAYALQGEINLQLQDYEQARGNYEKAVRLNPQLPRPYFGLATVSARLGLKAEASKYREKFKELEGQAQDVAKDRRANFDPLRVTRQSTAHTHADVAQIYRAENREALARVLWERARALDPQNVTSVFSLADLELRAGRHSEALALYQQVVTIQPQNGAAHFFIGHIHEKTGKLDAAEQAYQSVIEASPQRPEGYLTLIRFYQETRPNLPKARLVAQALTKLVPTASNFALLARICYQLKEPAPALAAIQRALDMAPHNAQYQALHQKIQEGR